MSPRGDQLLFRTVGPALMLITTASSELESVLFLFTSF